MACILIFTPHFDSSALVAKIRARQVYHSTQALPLAYQAPQSNQDVTVLLETAAIISKRTDGKYGRVRALCSKACNAHADEVAGRALTAQSACLEHEFTSSTVSPHRRMGLLKDSVRFVSSAAWCLHRGGCV